MTGAETEVGIDKRKQESKKRKENTASTKKKKKNDNGQEKKGRKHALDKESMILEKNYQEKRR